MNNTNYYLKHYKNDKIYICAFSSDNKDLVYELYALLLCRNNQVYIMQITPTFFYDYVSEILNDIKRVSTRNIELVELDSTLPFDMIILDTFNNFDELKEKYVEYFV